MSKLPDNLIPMDDFKGGRLYQNPEDNRLWFVTKNERAIHIYSATHLNRILEWGKLELKLDKAMITGFKEKETLHDNRFPVRCVFADGTVSDYCLLILTDSPPEPKIFDKGPNATDWMYANRVTEISFSPAAVPESVIREMKKIKKKSDSVVKKNSKKKNNFPDTKFPSFNDTHDVVVKDDKGKFYRFSDQESFVFLQSINPATLLVVSSPTEEEQEQALDLSSDTERKEVLMIYADK